MDELRESGTTDVGTTVTYAAFPRRVKNWLAQYGVFETECQTHGIVYSESKQSLVLGLQGDGAYYTRRYFGDNSKHPRYITGSLSKQDRIVVFEPPGRLDVVSECVVLVEDYVSALVVGRVHSASPLFRAHVSGDRLKQLVKRFKDIRLWLDPDKYADALKLTARYRSVGFPMLDPIKSDKDPKYYSPTEIREYVES